MQRTTATTQLSPPVLFYWCPMPFLTPGKQIHVAFRKTMFWFSARQQYTWFLLMVFFLFNRCNWHVSCALPLKRCHSAGKGQPQSKILNWVKYDSVTLFCKKMWETFSTLKTYLTFLLSFLFTKLSQIGVSHRVSVTVSVFLAPLIHCASFSGPSSVLKPWHDTIFI